MHRDLFTIHSYISIIILANNLGLLVVFHKYTILKRLKLRTNRVRNYGNKSRVAFGKVRIRPTDHFEEWWWECFCVLYGTIYGRQYATFTHISRVVKQCLSKNIGTEYLWGKVKNAVSQEHR